MNKYLSKYLLYYPTTLAKGELVSFYLSPYRMFQHESAEAIGAYQLAKLKKIVDISINNSTFYKDLYFRAGIKSSHAIESLSDIRNLPTVTKKDIIDNGMNMHTRSSLWSTTKTTGGSTGQPVSIKKNPDALARERAATWTAYEWAGVTIGDKQARFWGVPHSKQGKVKATIIDYISNRRRLSAFNLTPASLDAYYHQLRKFSPKYLYGYVSVINAFAQHMLEKSLPPIPSIESVITTSEILTDSARRKITSAFAVPIYNEYGCGEVGSIAHECEHGAMHIMSQNLYVEIEPGSSDSGEIIVTDFFNHAMPLIRYRIGDFAALSPTICACGRTLPVLKGIHGRAYDIINTPEGRDIHPEALIYVFEDIQKKSGSFSQFQAIQETIDRIRIRVVPTHKWTDETWSVLQTGLTSTISQNISYALEICATIDREPSGKMRLVKNNSRTPQVRS